MCNQIWFVWKHLEISQKKEKYATIEICTYFGGFLSSHHPTVFSSSQDSLHYHQWLSWECDGRWWRWKVTKCFVFLKTTLHPFFNCITYIQCHPKKITQMSKTIMIYDIYIMIYSMLRYLWYQHRGMISRLASHLVVRPFVGTDDLNVSDFLSNAKRTCAQQNHCGTATEYHNFYLSQTTSLVCDFFFSAGAGVAAPGRRKNAAAIGTGADTVQNHWFADCTIFCADFLCGCGNTAQYIFLLGFMFFIWWRHVSQRRPIDSWKIFSKNTRFTPRNC